MRWQYKITLTEGTTSLCLSHERIWGCRSYANRKFGDERVTGVQERYGDGKWVDSELLPLSQEEADSVEEVG